MPVANPYLKGNKRSRLNTEGTKTNHCMANPYLVQTQTFRQLDQQIQPTRTPIKQRLSTKIPLNPYARSENVSLGLLPAKLQFSNQSVDASNKTPAVQLQQPNHFQNNSSASALPTPDVQSIQNSALESKSQIVEHDSVVTAYKTTTNILDTSFDDSGIDWDAALRIMDQTINQRQILQVPVDHSMSIPPTRSVPIGVPSQPHSTHASEKTTVLETTSNPQCLERPSQWTTEAKMNSDSLPKVLQFSQDRVHPVSDEYRQALVQNANLSATLNNGWKLFTHQKRAILKALLMRRCILALDCGLGKTIIGCVWAKSMQKTYTNLAIYIICPVSMTQEWQRTAEEATGLVVAKNDDISLNYCMHICSWAKVPTAIPLLIPHYVIVCDEAHSMQSMTAQRTQSVLKLIAPSRCVGVLLLSGTPMKNGKPSNLFPLLKAVKHPFGEHQKAFETYFCAGHQKQIRSKVVWDASGSSNLGELNESISSHLLYMSKEEVLTDLPPQTRETRQVAVSSRHRLQHNAALADLARIYKTSGSLEHSGDAVLTAVQKVRMIGAFAKIDATVALAKEVLQTQPAVVIFSSFAQVAKAVHKHLADSGWEGELLTGETPAKKRQGMVDKFQQGLSPVFVSTFGAGGVGLTLTAAFTIILLDRPWTPGEAKQAEDRVRRIGQTKAVKSIWMASFDLDKQIDELLEQKKVTSDAVLTEVSNQEPKSSACDAPKISIFQLLRSVLVHNTDCSS